MKKYFTLIIILAMSIQTLLSQEKGLEVGDTAKDFSAFADNGMKWTTDNLPRGKHLVVYFYPAAMTGGCTKQACAYRDDKSELDDLNAVIIGISGDEVKNLELFKKAHNLNFTLLSDPDGKIADYFGVPVNRIEKSIARTIEGSDYTLTRQATTSRWTFIINSEGKVIYKSTAVDAANDSENVIKALQSSQ